MFRTLNSLHLLHNIIGDALNELDCAYRAKGLDYPSLEESGTVDEREQLALTPSLIAASDRIVAACDQLLATVRSPYASVCDAAMSVRRLLSNRVVHLPHSSSLYLHVLG